MGSWVSALVGSDEPVSPSQANHQMASFPLQAGFHSGFERFCVRWESNIVMQKESSKKGKGVDRRSREKGTHTFSFFHILYLHWVHPTSTGSTCGEQRLGPGERNFTSDSLDGPRKSAPYGFQRLDTGVSHRDTGSGSKGRAQVLANFNQRSLAVWGPLRQIIWSSRLKEFISFLQSRRGEDKG